MHPKTNATAIPTMGVVKLKRPNIAFNCYTFGKFAMLTFYVSAPFTTACHAEAHCTEIMQQRVATPE